MSKVAVIGAGPMGLACAYALLKQGKQVDIYEADDRIGGMSAHFDFNGLSIERYYHFVCKPDQPTFDMLAELNIKDKLKWTPTKMGYFYAGRLYDWGNPIALLKFNPISLLSRLRYGLHMFLCTKRNNGDNIDSLEASAWIKKWIGQQAYDVLWKKLFALKFHHFKDNLSASWIWARIKRVGVSRRSLFQEEMGYIEGGSQTLLDVLTDKIRDIGGQIHLSTPVQKVVVKNKQVTGVQVNGEEVPYSQVVSTIPLPFVSRIVHDLSPATLAAYENIDNIAVVCVLFKTRKPVTQNFWLNVNDERMEIPGIIELSNLRPLDTGLVYVPFYLPQDHPKYQNSDEDYLAEAKSYIKMINTSFSDADFLDAHVSRYAFAQPICPPGFKKALPPIKTEVSGLYVLDTSYYYPEDRSISESFGIGIDVAKML